MIGVGDVVAVLFAAAGEAFRGAYRCADGGLSAAGQHIAVARHVLLIKGEDLVLGVGATEIDGVNAQLEVAEVHADVGCPVVVAVLFDQGRARVRRQAGLGACGFVVGLDVHGAERGADIDVVIALVTFVGIDAAADRSDQNEGRQRKQGEAQPVHSHLLDAPGRFWKRGEPLQGSIRNGENFVQEIRPTTDREQGKCLGSGRFRDADVLSLRKKTRSG